MCASEYDRFQHLPPSVQLHHMLAALKEQPEQDNDDDDDDDQVVQLHSALTV